MNEPDVATWTRKQVEARLDLARKATQVPWEPEGDDPTDDEVWIDVDGKEWRHVICRGPQSHENMLHVAANDPQDTIARCETELAILDMHAPTRPHPEFGFTYPAAAKFCGYDGPGDNWQAEQEPDHFPDALWPCRTVRLLAASYKYWPGYLEAWSLA